MKKALLGWTREELKQVLRAHDPKPYRAHQLFEALHRRRIADLRAATDLPLSLRESLAAEYVITDVEIIDVFQGGDGTRRYLLRLRDGVRIESVWLPEPYADTICLSTQAGCPLACQFCMTARLGLQRNLDAGEILAQVWLVLNDIYGPEAKPERGVNLVLMGMGEPLLNYENVMKAIRLFCDPRGMGISQRRITLSTAGVAPRIRQLAEEPIRPELAISLTATTNALRDQLMPINRRWPLEELLAVCREYPLRRNEWISFEYVMLDGINDGEEDARRLVRLLRGIRAKVNLIPHNPAPELPFTASPESRILRFQQILRAAGIPTFIRQPRGREIAAACGQLAARQQEDLARLPTLSQPFRPIPQGDDRQFLQQR
ncbi:MAG: 23S rRNA (adenine(2503)-C(2))-methyltransferase RlmN [Blastocatellia bacterium]|nr:23S rRNA (adenine(2503)-C(2))-methyltransferase RlmN [Blastocatellia bacterium]MCS7158307.1 23S rRNA (adenine(2503)-C(2))-methyltransferase RlmN [Blastocatellia bacterium]MCX7753145.1 23S rRNA (adenine(2503)-C(2))-methyltransferase RlmN [Blastocatellia bacterium]MDW8169460.1 23S rRNA (adenine(2503)-C(2))-methyltransferase RlmN [Acidobacteriota bacterium]MDW8255734.1 23S rRNA (adenine(2503)-C(2))-methyltransferase RlmN [Acidobacteriota bacterium]